MIVAGVAALTAWGWDQSRMETPLIDIRLLSRRPIALAILAYFILCIGGVQVTQMLTLLWQQPPATGAGFGLSATQSGLLFMLIQPISLISAPASGALAARHGARIVAVIGAVVLGLSWIGLAATFHGLWTTIAFTALIVLALGVVQPSILNVVVEAAPARQTGEAAGVAFVSYMVAMAVGSRVLFTLLDASIAKQAGHDYPSHGAFLLSFVFIIVTVAALILVLVMIPRRAVSSV